MTYIPDLTSGDRRTWVGYLSREHDFPRGEVSEAILARLVELAEAPLGSWAGYHSCDLELCGSGKARTQLLYRGQDVPDQCSTDILVPAENFVYVAPALILHYILRHKYQPPACFLEAVLKCPQARSREYVDAVKQAGPDYLKSNPM